MVARAPPLEKQPESGATEQSKEPQDTSLIPSQALPSQDQPATDMVSEGGGGFKVMIDIEEKEEEEQREQE